MVSCLTLIDRTHRLAAHSDGVSTTACGMALADAVAGPGLFAIDSEPSCERCRNLSDAPARPPISRGVSAREVVTDLLKAIGNADAHALDQLLVGSSPVGHRPLADALERLHTLFPDWRAHSLDLIAEAPRAVVRYAVSCQDPCQLLADRSPPQIVETIIVTVVGGQIRAMLPVTDAFGFWAALLRDRPGLATNQGGQ